MKGGYSFLVFPDYTGFLVALNIDSIGIHKFVDFWERIWRVVEPIEKLFGGGPGQPTRSLVTCGYGDKSCGLRILVTRETVEDVTKEMGLDLAPALTSWLKKHARDLENIVDYCEKRMEGDI